MAGLLPLRMEVHCCSSTEADGGGCVGGISSWRKGLEMVFEEGKALTGPRNTHFTVGSGDQLSTLAEKDPTLAIS